MPTTEQYQHGYGLKTGLVFSDFQLVNLDIAHKVVTLWNEYEYPTELKFNYVGSGSSDEKKVHALFVKFTEHINGIRIIETDSGRPYKCLFQYPLTVAPVAQISTDYKSVTIKYKGFAKRIGRDEASKINQGLKGW